MHRKSDVLPQLPDGVRIVDKPQGIEYQTRGDGVHIPLIKSL